jgi:hypothetical protein
MASIDRSGFFTGNPTAWIVATTPSFMALFGWLFYESSYLSFRQQVSD